MALSSKADREILAQNILTNEEKRAVKERQLFGIESSGIGGASRYPLLSNNPQLSAKASMGKRGKPHMKRSSPKGKAPIRPTEEYLREDHELEWEEMPERNWDKPSSSRSNSTNRTMLEWASFDWKPDPKNFLRGISNYSIYRETILLQLECIGYHSEIKLTPLDELKLAAVIQRTVTEEVAEMIVGMKSGSAMIKLFESTYRRTGIIQVEAFWESLSGLKYTGGCPVKFVTKFKTEARNYQAAGGQSSSTHLMILFKQAVKDKARKWHSMVSSLSRFHEWKLEQLLQDFISSHFERIGRGDGLTKNSQADVRGVLSNTQIEKDKSPMKKQHGKGDAGKGRGKRIRCWRCKGEGHFANKCPKRNDKSSINSTNSGRVAPPAGLTNEYCVVSEDEASSINYSAKVLPQNFEDLVDFYDREIARRSVNTASQEPPEIESPAGSINIAQQILSTSSLSSTTDRWLFDTGADIDATNRRTNLVPETIVDLGPKQFPVQTGSGIVFAECVGEVLLPLKGIKSERTVIRLKYVVCLKSLPLNIMSGERFYRRGGYLDRNRIVNPEGRTITHIDTERRGFFLWLHGRPEPLKSVGPHKPVTHHTSSKLEVFKESKSTTNNAEDQEFKVAYNACYTNGIFKMSDDVTRRLILWHRRLCHPSADRLKWTIKNTIGIDLDPSDVKLLPCEACDMGKSVKFTTSSRRQRMENVGEGWHCDVGSLSPVSLEGYEYFCLTTEDVSRYRIFRALKKKSEAAEELKTILSRANSELRLRHNLRVKRITIDGGRDWGLTSFQNFANDEEIEVIVSAPDNQYQNGVSERGIRFVQDAARCCSIQMKIPSVFWNYMLEMACYTLNCSSQSSVKDHKTPWEVYWSKIDPIKAKTKVDHLWIPGSRCITHVDASHRITGEKLDARGTRSVFFGYRGRKNKLVWLLDGGRFLVSPQVTAFESVDTNFGWTPDPREIVRSLPNHVQERLKSRKTDYARNEDYNVQRQSPIHPLLPRGRGRPKKTIQRPFEDQLISVLEAPLDVDDELAIELNEESGIKFDENSFCDKEGICDAVTGRKFLGLLSPLEDVDSISISKVVRKAIEHQQNDFSSDGDDLFRIMVNNSDIPSYFAINSADEPSFREAMKGPERDHWTSAMNVEIDGLLNRGTFKFVPREFVKGRKRLVTSKWVLKKKYKSNMKLDKFKARMVARGFTQVKGVDYNETSSTTARSASWRILMALAALNEWYVLQADFIAAYLAGELKETIFMEQFPYLKEYFINRPEAATKFGYLKDGVIELRKPLYGLKQSGACWQEKIRSIMRREGFEPLISDNAIYRNKGAKIIVASYVDDFLLIGPVKSELQSLTKSLNAEVALTDLGDANWFLGVRIRRSSDIGSILLDQNQYLERSFQDLKIPTGKYIETPMSVSSKIDMKKNIEKATASELYNFQRLVGKYIFSSCMIRCDTAQATSQMARFMCNPSPLHHKHMLRIPQYLSGCPEKGLLYKKNHRHLNDFGNFGLHCAVDSSFADDYNTAKSTTGYVIFMAGSPVIWKSKLQSTVSTLTCEAEFAAVFEASKDCAWIRNFLTELDQMPPGPIPILEDNTGAIKWAKDDGMTSGRRHVRIEYHYVVQEIRASNIDIRYIPTGLNPADGFTKPLATDSFKKFLEHLGLQELKLTLRLRRRVRLR